MAVALGAVRRGRIQGPGLNCRPEHRRKNVPYRVMKACRGVIRNSGTRRRALYFMLRPLYPWERTLGTH